MPDGNGRLAQTDPWFDTAPREPLASSLSVRETVQLEPAGWNARGTVDALAGARSVGEQLRDFLHVEPRRPGAGSIGGRAFANAPTPAAAEIDLDAVADAWIRETVQSLVQSALRLNVNEAGQATFSVMGLGEFTLTVSGDRSRITLAEGGDTLLALQRARDPGGGGERHEDAPSGHPGGGVQELLDGQPQILKAIALVADIASHPLSLLMYCVAAAYVLLWGVLSQQRNRSALPPAVVRAPAALAEPAPSKRRRKSRRRTSVHRSRLAGEPSRRANGSGSSKVNGMSSRSIERAAVTPSEMPTGKRRKRIRMRIRTRVRRPPSGHRV